MKRLLLLITCITLPSCETFELGGTVDPQGMSLTYSGASAKTGKSVVLTFNAPRLFKPIHQK